MRKPRPRHSRLSVAGPVVLATVLWVILASAGRLGVAAAAPAEAVPATGAGKPATAPAVGYECRWAPSPVTVDGDGSDAAWAAAPVLDSFRVHWPAPGRPAAAGTRARLLWDREYLYFLADMDDADLRAEVTEHDGRLWEQDVFELFFKPAADKSGYYEFEVNPANAVLDMFLPSRGSGGYERYKADGAFDVRTAARVRGTLNKPGDADQGWTVEGRIAWKGFQRTGGRPEPGDAWTFALCRVNDSGGPATQELSTAAPLGGPKPDFHRYEDYAPIRFAGPAAPAGGPATGGLPPLTTSRVVGSPDPPPPYRAVRAYPKLQVPFPIAVDRQPGGQQMLGIVSDKAYGPTKLIRFADEPEVAGFETLVELDAVAYDVAFHPGFGRNGYVYVGLNGPLSGKGPKRTQVVRYRMGPGPQHAIDPASATTIIEWESDGHNGGAVDFGPDGMLYVTSGDGTSDSDTWLSGQDLSRLLAKVLRIDVDHPDAGRHYSVPKDNPFVGQPNVRPETWCYGLRNPWRMAFDPATGQLWVTQNGQDQYEQVYLVERGANYGWSATEGSHPFYPDRHRGPKPVAPPTAEHPHAEARSLTGGVAYHGDALPGAVRAAYVYGDYSTGKIWGVRHDGTKPTFHQELADTTLRITGFGTSAGGELLVLDFGPGGGIYRLEPTPPVEATAGEAHAAKFPRRLSESGLFESVKGHAMADGVIPYSVNAELWSDGASKARFIAIPAKAGEDRRIGFTAKRGFEFPDGTVLVKSFALDAAGRNPDGPRWVETRFLTKQQGEWIGYSYEWDEAGTDATLVGAGGKDRTFEVRDAAAAGGARPQTWHYPSRAECMVCHTRAQNFVLGLNVLQLNKDHDYGTGRPENQLAALERLGVLRADGKGQGGSTSLLPKDPARYDRLVDPYDASADLTARARSYLHANCANCHVEAGGGNAAMELEFTTAADKVRVHDAKPLHNAFGLPDARLVAPGAPDRSVLLHRMGVRGNGTGQMPPLSTHIVDERAVTLIRKWIQSTAPSAPEGPAPGAKSSAGP